MVRHLEHFRYRLVTWQMARGFTVSSRTQGYEVTSVRRAEGVAQW